jgi:CRP-like cAMP-binding protein/small-conductance mechanosensitive channel
MSWFLDLVAAANWQEISLYERIKGGAALALLLVLPWLLPAAQRSLLWMPATVWGFHVLLLASAGHLSGEAAQAARVLAFFLGLAALGHAGVLLLLELDRRRRQVGRPHVVRRTLVELVYGVALLVTLPEAGVHAAVVLTVVGLATVTALVALRHALADLTSGWLLKAQRPFTRDDWITVEGPSRLSGQVVEINWRATRLLNPGQGEVVVPNAWLAQYPVHNQTRQRPHSLRRVAIACPLSVPPGDVRRAVLDALRGCGVVLSEPAPAVLTQGFDDGAGHYAVQFFIGDPLQGDAVDSQVRELLWHALGRRGIALAWPGLRTVTVADSEEKKAQLRAARLAQRKEYLRKIDLFAQLAEDGLHQLATVGREASYARDEVVVRQGEEGQELFIVHRGAALVTEQGALGKDVEVNRLAPGDFFGEIALLTGDRRTATVRTTQECELYVLDRDGFARTLAEVPGLVDAIRQVLKTRLANSARLHEEARAKANNEAPQGLVERFLKNYGMGW